MLIEKAYKYCPVCGTKDFAKKKGTHILACSSCGYEYFIEPVAATAAIIVNNKNEVLLVERDRAPKKGWYDLPGGFMDNTETVEQAIIRELQEELGVKGTMKSFVGAFTNSYLYKGISIPTISIIVTVSIAGNIKVADDVSNYRFFTLEEALKQKLAFSAVIEGLKEYKKIRDTV